ncbi:MAG TPA: ATP-binding protein [Woeseiaceae bacterium]|nr:ATP-binding protein [Woeseiaceae bacterium]
MHAPGQSLRLRVLVSGTLLLLVFFGLIVGVLDSAFRSAALEAERDLLDSRMIMLLAAAEPADGNTLVLPVDLPEPLFGSPGSGLYGALVRRGDGAVWRSDSAIGIDIPWGAAPATGERSFRRIELADGTPLLALSMGIDWEFPDGTVHAYIVHVAAGLDSLNAQVASFRRQLLVWFGLVAALLLASLALLLRWLLRPLAQIESEITEIEAGERPAMSAGYPAELAGVARNLNQLIDSERARAERHRRTLQDLAHSLKTPLAAMRSLLEGEGGRGALDDQVARMEEIVRYQLAKPLAGTGATLGTEPVPVAPELGKLADGLQKVYRDRGLRCELDVEPGLRFYGDRGDLLELAGNLMENAHKWGESRVRVSATRAADGVSPRQGMVLTVEDDGPGIPDGGESSLLERGRRLDESKPGQGIGLSVVVELADAYRGGVEVARSDLGGARVTVRLPPG